MTERKAEALRWSMFALMFTMFLFRRRHAALEKL